MPLAALLMIFVCLLAVDVQVALGSPQFRPAGALDWFYLIAINIGLLALLSLTVALTVPDFLAVYSEDGVQWPSLKGYQLIRWSDVISVEDSYTFWRHRKIILHSPQKQITINPEIFITEDEIIDELKKPISQRLWTENHPTNRTRQRRNQV